jgi:hypothetical protein
MKKVFLVLLMVAVYGVSMANYSPNVSSVKNTQVSIVTDVDGSNASVTDNEKDKSKTTETKTAKAEGTEKAKSDGCATAKSDGCGTAKAGCGGEKSKTSTAQNKEVPKQ